MIDQQSIQAIIPTQSASRGIPGKNGKLLYGKSLLEWTIESAKYSKYCDEIIVSTDATTLVDIAAHNGIPIPVLRRQELASDQAKTTDVIYLVLTIIQKRTGSIPDHIILLQPTSPPRNVNDVDHVLEKYFKIKSELLISVTLVYQNPHWMKIMTSEDKITSFLSGSDIPRQRQLLPELYYPKGAFYIAKTDRFLAENSLNAPEIDYYLMPSDRSIDIDSEIDFRIAELVMTQAIDESKSKNV